MSPDGRCLFSLCKNISQLVFIKTLKVSNIWAWKCNIKVSNTFAMVINESLGPAGETHIWIVYSRVIVLLTLASYLSIIASCSYFTMDFCLITDLGIQNEQYILAKVNYLLLKHQLYSCRSPQKGLVEDKLSSLLIWMHIKLDLCIEREDPDWASRWCLGFKCT